MIPYTGFTKFYLGPVPIQVWGLLVALGFVAGMLVVRWYARKRKLNVNAIMDLAFWTAVAGFIGARFGHVFLYDWSYYQEHLIEILYVWQGGFSSVGGFVGAAVVVLWWYKKKWPALRSSKSEVGKYADVLAFAFPLAWGIGRIGCFLIHDHPGVCTNFALGMQQSSGCARHDLGLYESIQAFLIFGLFLLLLKKYRDRVPRFLYTGLLMVLYGIPRFFFDFLRIESETRYAGLTPAQYGSIILAFVGVVLLYKIRGGKSVVARTN